MRCSTASRCPRRRMSDATPTLEREHELDRIAAALDAAAAGTGRAVVIEGPPGIGKSRLIDDARALAKLRGFGRLAAAGDELESAIPWSVVRQMADRAILRHPPDVRATLLAEGAPAAALAALDEAAAGPGTEAAIGRTLHALWWIVADLAAQRPLLVTLDDAHWADAPSLRFLAYLSRRLARPAGRGRRRGAAAARAGQVRQPPSSAPFAATSGSRRPRSLRRRWRSSARCAASSRRRRS